MFPIISGVKSKLIAFFVPQEKILFWPYNELNPLQIKPIRSRWLIISLALFRLPFTDRDEKKQKRKNDQYRAFLWPNKRGPWSIIIWKYPCYYGERRVNTLHKPFVLQIKRTETNLLQAYIFY